MLIFIGGINKTGLYKNGTLRISDGINERSTCSLLFVDKTGLYRPSIGETFEMWDESNLIFSGTIDEPEEENPLGTTILNEDIQVVDWHQVADRRLVAEVYENQTAGYIARDIRSKYLADEGVIEGTIQDGPVIVKAVFNYITASQCYDELSEITGYQWNINGNKSLDFFDRATNAAPWPVTENSKVRNVRVRRTREKYRNRQYVRAGQDISTVQIREYLGDGKTKVWTVDLPAAKEPVIKVNGIVKTVGIRGVEQDKDFYWNKNDKTISQDDFGAALTSSDTLRIEYQGFYPIMVLAEDPDAVSERQSIEGGTGYYEVVEDKQSIDQRMAAVDYANGLLRRYAQISEILTFDTDQSGLKAGQLLPVDLPGHNLSGDFLISRVTISDPGFNDGGLRYNIEALSGEAIGGWAAFWKKLVQNQQTFVIRENEILVKLLTFRDVFIVPRMEDEMTYILHQYKICGQVVCGTGVIL